MDPVLSGLTLVCVVCVWVSSLPFAILTVRCKPYIRGFFCSDESISYPYVKETISMELMAAVTISSSIIIITTGEAYMVCTKRIYSRSECNNYVAALYKVVGTFFLGSAISQSLTDIAKYTVGRLRPNFLSVCNPNMTLLNCSAYQQADGVCTGPTKSVTEARLSFYSGHSSFGMYCMVFLSLYLQARLQAKWARLVRPTIQFFLIAFALYVGYTRVSDYRHYWSDVLVGLFQGAIVAVLIVRYMSDFFKHRPLLLDESETETERKPNIPLTETEPMNYYGSRSVP
uniref:Phospholipid phosphatase 2a n=1 Tax=Callorhinchus milii TaxID=7868 RepID=A0A4W3HFT7_CALMI